MFQSLNFNIDKFKMNFSNLFIVLFNFISISSSLKINPYGNKYPISGKYYEEHLKRLNKRDRGILSEDSGNLRNRNEYISKFKNKYPISGKYYEEQLKRLNSNDLDEHDRGILGEDYKYNKNSTNVNNSHPNLRIILSKDSFLQALGINIIPLEDDGDDRYSNVHNENIGSKDSKSQNFRVIKNYPISFKDVGGYENIKNELNQCVDLLKNYRKYEKFNVRVPKGLILEGPPGTGKTLMAKALAGEANCGFIAVSGSDFQEKYIGVGPTRIKELFGLANKNKPCIIFIDEIDALGRKRSSDGESSSSERDNTLNALLVELDGFKNSSSLFVVCATNRIDLLDNALTRPGRIDKKIFIGPPDAITRRSIFNIHIKGKPYDKSINLDELIETTDGLTGAQIENLLNEAMLNALRENREEFTFNDFDLVLNKMVVGWQPTDHIFSKDIVEHIAIHEMGHAVLGVLSNHHSKMSKVVINLSSPRSPGYTVFEPSSSNIYTRESLFEHLMILLGGRIAEDIFYGGSVTTGAINDFEQALKLAEKMVLDYGMGTNIIYPSSSDKYKELIDNDVIELINRAHTHALSILEKAKPLIKETSDYLINEKLLTANYLNEIIDTKYSFLKQENIIYRRLNNFIV
jgi:cell division protease FtsH